MSCKVTGVSLSSLKKNKGLYVTSFFFFSIRRWLTISHLLNKHFFFLQRKKQTLFFSLFIMAQGKDDNLNSNKEIYAVQMTK